MMDKALGMMITACMLLSGCGDKNEASKANFENTIKETYKTTMPCLQIAGYYHAEEGIAMVMEPDHVSDEKIIADEPLPKALADLSLFTLQVVRKPNSSGTEVPFLKMTLTEKGNPYFHDLRDRIDEMPSLCFGRYVLDSIDRFSQPASIMGQTLSEVQYTYHIEDLPDWTKDPELLKHSDWLRQLVTNPKHFETKTFILTNKGWEDKEVAGL